MSLQEWDFDNLEGVKFLFKILNIFLEFFWFDSAFFISCFASLDTFLSSLDNIFESGYTSSLTLFPKIKFKIGYLETVTGNVLLLEKAGNCGTGDWFRPSTGFFSRDKILICIEYGPYNMVHI